MTIIGIAGGTGSGKTTVVKKIIEALPVNCVALVPQDSYYNDTTHLTSEERKTVNFDHPDAFDWELLLRQLNELKEGKSIEQPTYSYIKCNREKDTIHVEPREVIIVEGIMAFANDRLREMMDLKIFIETDEAERLIRNIRRDTKERGRTVDMVTERFNKVIKPMHEQFVEPTKRFADIILPNNDGASNAGIDLISKYILHLVRKKQAVSLQNAL